LKIEAQPEAVTHAGQVRAVLQRRTPARIVYAPNYWQWFTHHRNHGLLPDPLRDCGSQLELIRHLGLDVFSRNIYSDPVQYWFGGLAEEVWDGVEVGINRRQDGQDLVTEKTYHTKAGTLTERLRYIFAESTLVQEKPLLDNFAAQSAAFDAWVRGRRWRFNRAVFEHWRQAVGEDGLVNAGELFSPLKLLHLTAGAAEAVFLLEDHPDRCAEWMRIHEAAQLDLVRQMLEAGVPAMMAMDNLDSAFHPPRYIERCSASFYEQASGLCHAAGAVFFIHACGRQRAILPLIAAFGVDGLEGVAYPTLGDVQLEEAMRLSGERLIITGGISALETERFQSRDEVRRYIEDLFRRLQPYRHRFMLSASCNTSIRTPWKTLEWFRDAWREFGN
jgi:uroporphyrinogen-III decarboxylase